MLLVHNERNTKTILRQRAEVGDSKVCNTTKTLVTYTLLYRISLFLICQFLVAWLYSSSISYAEFLDFSKKKASTQLLATHFLTSGPLLYRAIRFREGGEIETVLQPTREMEV